MNFIQRIPIAKWHMNVMGNLIVEGLSGLSNEFGFRERERERASKCGLKGYIAWG